MNNNQKLATTCLDESLYDVVVHTDEDRKKHKECVLGNHSVYLLFRYRINSIEFFLFLERNHRKGCVYD